MQGFGKKHFSQPRTTDLRSLITVGAFLKDLISTRVFNQELMNCAATLPGLVR